MENVIAPVLFILVVAMVVVSEVVKKRSGRSLKEMTWYPDVIDLRKTSSRDSKDSVSR